MGALGPRDLSSLVTLTGWDADEIRRLQLADGTSYAAVVTMLQGALVAVAGELFNDPLWLSLVSYQDTPELEYRQGSSSGMQRHTEYSRPDPYRGDTAGHMLPFVKFDRALNWTWDYLREARMSHIEADIADAVEDVRSNWRVSLLTRLLKRGDESGKENGLGTTGLSPGFVTDAGSTGVDFVPPSYGGNSFTSAHEHYVAIAGGAPTLAMYQDIKAELREHGHQPPYSVMISPTDETATRGITGFVPAPNLMVNYGANTATATFGNTELSAGIYSIGVIEDCRIWTVPGFPQYYAFGWKTYGANSQRNPLRIRTRAGVQRPYCVAMPDPNAGNATHPLQYMMFFQEYGVGVGQDRTNGTARYTNNSSWADGTPN